MEQWVELSYKVNLLADSATSAEQGKISHTNQESHYPIIIAFSIQPNVVIELKC